MALLSETDYYSVIGKDELSTCETVSNMYRLRSWSDLDSGSIISGEMLNYIIYAHKSNSILTADNLPSPLESDATSHIMVSSGYMDYHNATQSCDVATDSSATTRMRQDLLQVNIDDPGPSTPKHMYFVNDNYVTNQ